MPQAGLRVSNSGLSTPRGTGQDRATGQALVVSVMVSGVEARDTHATRMMMARHGSCGRRPQGGWQLSGGNWQLGLVGSYGGGTGTGQNGAPGMVDSALR